MAKPKPVATEGEISRDRPAKLLNEDLSCEYQAIIVVVRYRMYPESRYLAANTINQKLPAVRLPTRHLVMAAITLVGIPVSLMHSMIYSEGETEMTRLSLPEDTRTTPSLAEKTASTSTA
jgi:hypothetical protein